MLGQTSSTGVQCPRMILIGVSSADVTKEAKASGADCVKVSDSNGCWVGLFWGDLTKPAITTASADRFQLNLVICLQLLQRIVDPEFY